MAQDSNFTFKEIDPLAPPPNSELITNSNGRAIWKQQQSNFLVDSKISYVNILDESENYIIKISDNVDEIFNNINALEVFVDGVHINLQILDPNVIVAELLTIIKNPTNMFLKINDDIEFQIFSFNEKGIYLNVDTSFIPPFKTISIINFETGYVYFNWNVNKDMPKIVSIKTDPLLSGSIPKFYLKDNILYCNEKATQEALKVISIYKHFLDTLNFAIVDFANNAHYRPIAISNNIVYYFDKTGAINSVSLLQTKSNT